MDQICDAVKSTVPQEMWGAIIEKLEELEQHPEALDVGEDAFDDSYDDPYDPTEFIDEDRRVMAVAVNPRRFPSGVIRWLTASRSP